MCNATAAPVTPVGKGGVWTLDLAPSAEGKTHHLQATLKPVTSSNTASASSASVRPDTPSDAVSYAVDSKPPTIKRIFPQGNKIDPAKPYAIYEIQDNPGGSGMDVSKLGNVKIDIQAPVGLHPKHSWVLSLKNGVPVVRWRIYFPDTTTLAGESYTFNITAKDRVGNVGRLTGDRFTGEAFAPSALAATQGIDCLYDIGVAPIINTYSTIVRSIIKGEGDSAGLDIRTIPFWGTSVGNWGQRLSNDIFGSLHISVTGPAKLVRKTSGNLHKVSASQYANGNSVIAGPGKIASQGSANPYMRLFSLQALKQAKNGDVVTVTVDMPVSARIAYLASADSGCSPTFDRLVRRTRSGYLFTSRQKGGARDFNIPAQLTGTRFRRSFQFRVLVKASPPKGKFVYDSKARTLDYVVTDAQPIEFDTVHSRASLSSDTSYTAKANMKKLDSGKFGYRFENITEGRYKVTANVSSVTLFNINGTTTPSVQMTSHYTVRAAAPTIRNFRYDYQKKQLLMSVDDTGTPRDRLSGKLSIDGNRYKVFFDSSGEASLALPQPPASMTASLQVFDLAGQGRSASRRILGTRIYDPASPPQQTAMNKIIANSDPQYIPSGGMKNGMKQYLKKCAPRSPRNTYIMSIDDRMALANLTTRNSTVVSGVKLRPGEILYVGKSTGLGVGSGYQSTFLYGPPLVSQLGCGQTVWMDKFAPNIRNFRVDPASGTFSALIDDNGGPLDTLNVSYYLLAGWKPHRFLSKYDVINREFNPRTGLLQGTFPVDPARERLKMVINVTDASFNNASAKKTITTPYAPPDIKLTHTAMNDSAGTVLLFAEMSDPSSLSGLIH